jgi:uncharacterized membrane protein (DUF2068 family)
MAQSEPSEPPTYDKGLRIIAVLKFAKGILFLAISFGIFRLINQDVAELARRLAAHLRIDPENHYLRQLLEKLTDLNPRKIRNLGFLSLFFSADLMIEGVGLWYNQTWAKYLVLLATGFFLPEEIRACVEVFTWDKLALLCLNLTFVAYIAWILLPHRRPPGPPVPTA